MKLLKSLFLLVLLAGMAGLAQAQHGTVREGLTIDSKILGKTVRYTVYLPYDYETSSRYYPVVYLLHGYSDDDTGWMQFGEAHMIADEYIARREIPPMILVMPDADVSWYINNFDGKVRYEDFFFQEFMPKVENDYRIRKEKRYRGISGLSMGGYGTLVYALRHPELFVAAAPFSAAVYTDEEVVAHSADRWAQIESVVYGPNLSGRARLTPHQQSYNILRMIEADPEKAKSIRWYIDCGDDDFLYKGNAALHVLMRDKEVPHEFRVRQGGHTWSYWRTGLPEALKFIGASFHQQ